MGTSPEQRGVFLDLKRSPHDERCWLTFWSAWDAFIETIIRHKLFFAPALWDDAKNLSNAKIFKFIARFDCSKEVSPWLSRVVASACEDVKKQAGYLPRVHQCYDAVVSLDDTALSDWLCKYLIDTEQQERQELADIWCVVEKIVSDMEEEEVKKTAFFLYYHYGYKLREIAEILRFPESTVNNWPGVVVRKIVPRLKQELCETDDPDCSQKPSRRP